MNSWSDENFRERSCKIITRKSVLTAFILCGFARIAFAQTAPEVEWERTFGGSSWEQGYFTQETVDGGYIVIGLAASFGTGDSDVYLVRTDAHGNKLWEKVIGIEGAHEDIKSAQGTADGGYIIAGTLNPVSAVRSDAYLLKTDAYGNKVWEKTFGQSDPDITDSAESVWQTTDGGYILAGSTDTFGAGSPDVYVMKTDPYGNKIWEKAIGGSGWEMGMSVRETSYGGYGAAGALMVSRKSCEHFRSPTVPIKSRVGAGDSMVGGMVLSLSRGKSLREAVPYGIAAGAAAVMNPRRELCRLKDTEDLFKRISTEPEKRISNMSRDLLYSTHKHER